MKKLNKIKMEKIKKVEKLHIRNHYDKGKTTIETEINDGEIITIDNQAMTIQEIMERAKGGIEPEKRNVQYREVNNINEIDENYAPMQDLTQIDINRKRVVELQNKIQEQERQIKEQEQNNIAEDTTATTEPTTDKK